MAFEQFPYTNLHDLNLDWLLKKIEEVEGNVEAVKRIIEMADLPEAIRQKLDEMAADGTLDVIINQHIFDQLNGKVEALQGEVSTIDTVVTGLNGEVEQLQSDVLNEHWIPNDAERDAYENWAAACVVSYLVNMPAATCNSIQGAPNHIDLRFVPIYLDTVAHLPESLMSYNAIVNNDIGQFGKYQTEGFTPTVSGNHNTITVEGQTYPILYSNCSNFVTQVCSGRRYIDSVWYNLFTRPDINARQLAVKALPYGDTALQPWTVDYMNLYYTWRMAECMNASGCTVNPIAQRVNGEVVTTKYFDTMRDGDVIFFGDTTRFSGRYRGIHHCALYFKTLDKLNAAAAAYGVTCKPFDGGGGSLGYVVDCSGSTDGVVRGTKNVFKISTMEYMLNEKLTGDEVFYFAKTDANALNSSKLHQNTTGTLVLKSCEITSSMREYKQDGDSILFDTVTAFGDANDKQYSYGYHRNCQEHSIVQSGGTLDANDYFGARKTGVYGVGVTNVTLVNFPTTGNVFGENEGAAVMATPSNVAFIFESVSPFESDTGIQLQRVTSVYNDAPHAWERCQNNNGTRSKWRCLY